MTRSLYILALSTSLLAPLSAKTKVENFDTYLTQQAEYPTWSIDQKLQFLSKTEELLEMNWDEKRKRADEIKKLVKANYKTFPQDPAEQFKAYTAFASKLKEQKEYKNLNYPFLKDNQLFIARYLNRNNDYQQATPTERLKTLVAIEKEFPTIAESLPMFKNPELLIVVSTAKNPEQQFNTLVSLQKLGVWNPRNIFFNQQGLQAESILEQLLESKTSPIEQLQLLKSMKEHKLIDWSNFLSDCEQLFLKQHLENNKKFQALQPFEKVTYIKSLNKDKLITGFAMTDFARPIIIKHLKATTDYDKKDKHEKNNMLNH